MHGLSFKIGFGRRIDCGSGGGTIVGFAPLCKQTEESNNHLFVHCRFTIRIWEQLKDWLGIVGLQPRQWAGIDIHDWWSSLVEGTSPHRKGLSSLALLVVWEI
jgi:hypothetical protein